MKLFHSYFSDIEHVEKYSRAAVILWNNFEIISDRFPRAEIKSFRQTSITAEIILKWFCLTCNHVIRYFKRAPLRFIAIYRTNTGNSVNFCTIWSYCAVIVASLMTIVARLAVVIVTKYCIGVMSYLLSSCQTTWFCNSGWKERAHLGRLLALRLQCCSTCKSSVVDKETTFDIIYWRCWQRRRILTHIAVLQCDGTSCARMTLAASSYLWFAVCLSTNCSPSYDRSVLTVITRAVSPPFYDADVARTTLKKHPTWIARSAGWRHLLSRCCSCVSAAANACYQRKSYFVLVNAARAAAPQPLCCRRLRARRSDWTSMRGQSDSAGRKSQCRDSVAVATVILFWR